MLGSYGSSIEVHKHTVPAPKRGERLTAHLYKTSDIKSYVPRVSEWAPLKTGLTFAFPRGW
jgi:hypothetical protein